MTREIDSIAVYGRTEGLAVYELIGLVEETAAEQSSWIASYEQGLSKYRERDFAGAALDFEAALRARSEDRPALLMLERCKGLAQSGVAEEWQPVAALQTK